MNHDDASVLFYVSVFVFDCQDDFVLDRAAIGIETHARVCPVARELLQMARGRLDQLFEPLTS